MNNYFIFLTFVYSSSSVLFMISVIEVNSGVLVKVYGFKLVVVLLTNNELGDVLVFSWLVLSFNALNDFLFVGVNIFLSSIFLNSTGSYASLFSVNLSNFYFKNYAKSSMS